MKLRATDVCDETNHGAIVAKIGSRDVREDMRWLVSTALSIFLTISVSWARPAENVLLYGPEWTFTSHSMVNLGLSFSDQNEILMKLRQHVAAYCQSSGACRVDNGSGALNRVYFTASGTESEFSTDPGVFEVQSTPQSLAQWRRDHKMYQRSIFDGMRAAGQIPHELEGSGHVNIGLAYFQDKPLLLRNFIVDFYSHPGFGIVMNSLAANDNNAPYLDQLRDEVQQKFLAGLRALDQIPHPDFLDVLYHLAGALPAKYTALAFRMNQVLVTPKSIVPQDISLAEFKKTFALTPSLRMEVRTLRPQPDMRSFLQVMEIFESKITKLAELKTRIPLRKIEPMKDPWVALGQFAEYLKGAGLSWKKFRNLMPPAWQDLPEENFVRASSVHHGALICHQAQRI